MKRFSLVAALLLFIAVSCGPRYSDFFLYNDDGSTKPKVVFLPVRSLSPKDAETAAYFDEALRYEALNHGQLYFYPKDQVASHCQGSQLDNPIQNPKIFLPAEYVVQVEVLQDEILNPKEAGCEPLFEIPGGKPRQAVLVQLRLKVVDIRDCEPRVISYQILEKSQILSKKYNRDCVPGSIYEELAEEVIVQIEDQIHCMR